MGWTGFQGGKIRHTEIRDGRCRTAFGLTKVTRGVGFQPASAAENRQDAYST